MPFTFKPDPSPSLPDKSLNDPSVGPNLVGGTVGFDGEHTLSGIKTATDYSGVYRDWVDFASGIKLLNSSLQPNPCRPHKTIEDVFRLLTSFWGQSLYVRAAGVFLMDRAANHVPLFNQVNKALSITAKNGDMVVFSSS